MPPLITWRFLRAGRISDVRGSGKSGRLCAKFTGTMTVPSFLMGFSSRFYRVSFTDASRFCRHVFLEPKADLIKGVGMFFFRPELFLRQWTPLVFIDFVKYMVNAFLTGWVRDKNEAFSKTSRLTV